MSEPVGASELLRSLGVLVDGPSRWGNPVSSRRPGVFVVELPGGSDSAPLDSVALRRWIEHVPSMRLDGEPPTPQFLARRLSEFWLSDEPILYIGRSTRAIGSRVAAMLATPLGDAQPYSAGYWLKTLAAQSELRVWWAETEAHEEYEDALFDALAGRNNGQLPFANLLRPGGEAKRHGLTDTLVAGTPLEKTAPAASKSARAGTRRASGAPGPAKLRRPRATAGSDARPKPEPTFVSRDGLVKLTAELDDLRSNVRPQVIARVKAARELGDLKENGDYEYARKEQSFVEGRILALEAMIKSSVLIGEAPATESAHLGSTLLVEVDGERETYLLVGPAEASPAAGRISHLSPVGRAFVGARAGDELTVALPAGSVVYRVVEVR